MGLEYDANIKTTLRPMEIMTLLSEELKTPMIEASISIRNMIFVSANEIQEISKPMYQSAFGFTPNVHIGFKLPSLGSQEDGNHVLAKAIIAILRKIDGEVVVLYNGEETIGIRSNNTFDVNSEWYELLIGELDNSLIKYSVKSLPSPLLG